MLPESFTFSPLKKRQIQADFSGGHITSDAGLLLLREIDRRCRLTQDVAACLEDSRQAGKVKHELVDLIRQRVYGLACGYEDLNDHDNLRSDLAFQTALNRITPLASKATLGTQVRH
ncbi:MAG: transposase [Hahellaceae bacterium]|nr:transposase [Hahellaceae bacterium]